MQRWNLHRRVALVLIARLGDRPKNVVGGFMPACAVVSMWVATTTMMLAAHRIVGHRALTGRRGGTAAASGGKPQRCHGADDRDHLTCGNLKTLARRDYIYSPFGP